MAVAEMKKRTHAVLVGTCGGVSCLVCSRRLCVCCALLAVVRVADAIDLLLGLALLFVAARPVPGQRSFDKTVERQQP